MNCRSCREHLAEYAAGSLPAKQAGAVEDHCAACDGCAAAMEAEMALGTALSELAGEEALRRDQWPQVAARLDREPRQPMKPIFWDAVFGLGLKLVPAWAVLLLISVGISYYYSNGAADTANGFETAQIAILEGSENLTANDIVVWLPMAQE